MPLARLAQYQHCLLRRNGTAARWGNTAGVSASVLDELRALRERWAGRAEGMYMKAQRF